MMTSTIASQNCGKRKPTVSELPDPLGDHAFPAPHGRDGEQRRSRQGDEEDDQSELERGDDPLEDRLPHRAPALLAAEVALDHLLEPDRPLDGVRLVEAELLARERDELVSLGGRQVVALPDPDLGLVARQGRGDHERDHRDREQNRDEREDRR